MQLRARANGVFTITETMFARIVRQAQPVGRRMLSGEAHDAEHAAITATWKRRTMIAVPVCGALALANVFIHMSHGHHEHDHEKLLYSYQRKLVKVCFSFRFY